MTEHHDEAEDSAPEAEDEADEEPAPRPRRPRSPRFIAPRRRRGWDTWGNSGP